MKTLHLRPLLLRLAVLSLVALPACTSKSTGQGASIATGSKPSNSQGSAADVTLQISTEVGNPSLRLTDTGLDLGNGVSLIDARVNIAKIKIKPARDEDADEKKLDDEVEARSREGDSRDKDKTDKLDSEFAALLLKYKDLFAAANSVEEKAAVRKAFEAELKTLKEQLASIKKGDEDAADALEAEKDPDVRWKGPYVYDLVSGKITPELPTATVFDGSYHRIQFQLKADRDSADQLLNNSVFIKGSTQIDGKATEFTFALGHSEKIRLKTSEGIKVGTDGKNILTIAFQPDKWFTNVDFSKAKANGLGLVVIDNQSNPEIFAAIKSNIKASTRCGKDGSRDGKEDDDSADTEDDDSEHKDGKSAGKDDH